MNELFLAAIVILASLTKGSDRAVAIVYALICHVVYFLSPYIETKFIFHALGAFEAVLVVMLVCFRWLSASKLTDYLIPVSLLGAVMDFYGWWMYMNGHGIQPFNALVPKHQLITILVFILVIIRYDRNPTRNRRFLRDYHNDNLLLGRTR